MEIRIGVKHVSREVMIESELSEDEVSHKVEEAINNGALLRLTGAKDRQVAVPGEAIAYVEFGGRKPGPVGFAHQATRTA